MAGHFDSTLSEDQLVALLCSEFGGLSASILQDAMGTNALRGNSSGDDIYKGTGNEGSDRKVDCGEENHGDDMSFDGGVKTKGKNMAASGARAVDAPVKSNNLDVFAHSIASLSRSAWKGYACKEALTAVIDSLVIASELESISNEGEHEAD